jgi:hypothetical protein
MAIEYEKIRSLMKRQSERLWSESGVDKAHKPSFELGCAIATAAGFFADLSEEKKAYWINYFNKDAS